MVFVVLEGSSALSAAAPAISHNVPGRFHSSHRRIAHVRFVRDLAGLDKRLAAAAPQTVLVDLTAETLQPLELIRRGDPDRLWGVAEAFRR